jgi:ubiquinone/menaquinone biosynthesis C-methylase UbiE
MTPAQTRWDYTQLAATYEQRADYAEQTVATIIDAAQSTDPHQTLRTAADVGAGTGKLTRMLLAHALEEVIAIEPNAQMLAHARAIGANQGAHWIQANAECLPLPSQRCDIVSFGSSFNVVNSTLALREAWRLLRPDGLLAILWNHRNLEDPLQSNIEAAIRSMVPSYAHGQRRTDPTDLVLSADLSAQSVAFKLIAHRRLPFVHRTDRADYLAAWRSHGTLARAAQDRFEAVIDRIDALTPSGRFEVPFSTALWVFSKCGIGR